jgi:hypothetical protein
MLVVVLVYLANGWTIGAGDTVPARYLPISLLREFNFDLNEFTFLYDEDGRRQYPSVEGDLPYFLRHHDGHYRSAYPPGPALLALPVYLLPVLAGMPATSVWVLRLEKLSAALITALSVAFLFWTLRELTTERWALIIAGVYALGTSSLSVSSQALWQHGPSQLCLAISLYLLITGLRRPHVIPYVGFTLAAAILMRPTNALLVLPLGCYLLHQHRRMLWQCGLYALPPLAFLVFYNYALFGSIGGGYGPGTLDANSWLWRTPVWEGFISILFSPGRGLFIYSPVLLFSLVGMVMVWISGPLVFRYMTVGVVCLVLLYSKWTMWWGGWSYGPRLLADLTPFLCLFLYPLTIPMDRRPALRAGFILCALLSIGCHVLGVFWYDFRWDALTGTDRHPERLWHWRTGPLVYHGKTALASGRRSLSSAAIRLLEPPTSATSPQQLAASYTLRALEPAAQIAAFPCGRISLSFDAVNRGEAVWLAGGPQDEGAVRLVWRWVWQGQEVPGVTGEEGLPYDIFPGQSYTFTADILPPGWPSDYTLEVQLVSAAVTTFADQGTDPVTLAIRVEPPITRAFEHSLATLRSAAGEPPRLTLTTDQPRYWPGGRVRLVVGLGHASYGSPVDVYLAVVWPDGRVSFQEQSGFVREPQGPWTPVARRVELPHGPITEFPLLALTLPDPLLQGNPLPPGCYASYLILTEPDTFQVITTARALFSLEP